MYIFNCTVWYTALLNGWVDLISTIKEIGLFTEDMEYEITHTECRAQPQTCGKELNFFKILS